MTAQEAINIVSCNRPPEAMRGKAHEAFEMAIKALEKQIPKKPIDAITSDNEFICMICPCCQEVAVEFNDAYCKRCGQKLDWGE